MEIKNTGSVVIISTITIILVDLFDIVQFMKRRQCPILGSCSMKHQLPPVGVALDVELLADQLQQNINVSNEGAIEGKYSLRSLVVDRQMGGDSGCKIGTAVDGIALFIILIRMLLALIRVVSIRISIILTVILLTVGRFIIAGITSFAKTIIITITITIGGSSSGRYILSIIVIIVIVIVIVLVIVVITN